MYDRPLVAVHGAAITDPDQIQAILLSIFREAAMRPGLMTELRDHLVAELPGGGCDYGALIAGIQAWLLPRTRSEDGAIRADALRARNLLARHNAETSEVSIAYSPRTKPNHGAVFWPDPTARDKARSIYDELPYACRHPLLDRSTPVGSAGSCFAMEIANHLRAGAYNYIVTEPNKHSSANWGIIFNTPSFRQLVERAFGMRGLPKLLWSLPGAAGSRYLDPFREDVEYASVEEYEADLERHIAAVREVLSQVKVFILTLGMNEVWTLKSDGSVIARCPWQLASYLVERHVLTAEENARELQRMLDIWRAHNPDLKVIVSVSPVPLHATFRADEHHVIAANAHSKSVLRVAAEMFCERNRDVYYFPAFETVLYCTERPWTEDQRHVSREAVANVMRLFETMFVHPSPPDPAQPKPLTQRR